jgi:hypothetical protein
MSLPHLAGYLVAVGGVAGLLAWGLVLVGHLLFEISKPSWTSLLLAIPRGSLFAVLIGFALRLWWRDRRIEAEKRQKP